jgi:hypothetical protein
MTKIDALYPDLNFYDDSEREWLVTRGILLPRRSKRERYRERRSARARGIA